jgi:hypothetical protein
MSSVNRVGLAKIFSAGILHDFSLRGFDRPSLRRAPARAAVHDDRSPEICGLSLSSLAVRGSHRSHQVVSSRPF